MTLTITNPNLEAMGLTEGDVLLELALSLYAAEKLTLGQASRLAGRGQECFLESLVSRKIAIHYSAKDALDDLATLRRFPLP